LILYGRKNTLKSLHKREAGSAGETVHEEAVNEQEQHKIKQAEKEKAYKEKRLKEGKN